MTATTEAPLDFAALAARVDDLRDRVSHQDPAVRALLEETIEAITEFNRLGIVALVRRLRDDARGGELLYESVEDPEVMALFVSHGVIRTDRTLDVLKVVEQIRPYLITSSIELDVEKVADDVAYVRFATGCSAPEQVAKDEIMGVIMQRVPGLRAVTEVVPEPGRAFVGLSSLRIGPPPESPEGVHLH